MEIQSAIDLIKYNGLWPTHGGGKPRGYRGDNGSGFFSPSSICFSYIEHIPILDMSTSGHWRSVFLDSVAWAAAVASTPASYKLTGFSGEVMDTSNAAVLLKNQLRSSMSAGRVLLWSLLRLLPTSTLTPM